MAYKAEYIWVDGTQPTAKLRSKTKIMYRRRRAADLGLRRLVDQPGHRRPLGLRAQAGLRLRRPDPRRPHKLVMCEVFLSRHEPHPTNTRAACARSPTKYKAHDTWFGIEQEYTFFDGIKPLGWPDNGFPAPQGGYYCGVGADEVFGRPVVEAHLDELPQGRPRGSPASTPRSCPASGSSRSARSAAPEVADQLWVARWLLYRIAEDFRRRQRLDRSIRSRSRATGTAPAATPTSRPRRCATSYEPCIAAAEALGTRHDLHIANYGYGIEERLTGQHETASYKEFTYGVSRPRRLGAHPVAGGAGQEGLHRGSPPERQHGPVRRRRG